MKGLLEERLAELRQLYPFWKKQTIWKFFEETEHRFPNREFIVAEGQPSYTYRRAKEEALQIARSLSAVGVRPGDHVAMQITNCPEQALVALAVSAIRAVKVALNTSLGTNELSYILNQSESTYLVTGCQDRLEGIPTKLKQVITLPNTNCIIDAPILEWDTFLTLGKGQALPDCDAPEYSDEISDIIYTSGSTSAPKGVLLSHDMLMRSAYASCINRGFEIGRRIFVPLPMFHVYGYVEGMLAAILVGGAVLLRRGSFDPAAVLPFMAKARANDILSVPIQMIALIEYLEHTPFSLPELHAVYCSASVCPSWVWPGIRRHLHVADIITGYGMTEVCGASMQTRPTDTDDILCSRVGRRLYGGCAGLPEYEGYQLQYKVVDRKTGLPTPPNAPGELWCRGTVVTRGYFHRPEVNARCFTPDGWFKTGDCGWFDEEGYLILAGRIDDMYKINGENVSPKFVEDIVGNCPVVSSIAVIGVPEETCGYVGVAFLQLHQDTPEHRREAETYCRKHLAKFQVPKHFIYLSEQDWPRTSTGKVQKFRLRELAASLSLPPDMQVPPC